MMSCGAWRSLLALCLLPLLSLDPTQAATLRVDRDAIELRGEIEVGDDAKFLGLLSDQIHLVRVRSPGGDMRTGLAIGRAMREHGLGIEVKGMCASACAFFLLPGAHQVKIDDGSIVALHGVGLGGMLVTLREGKLQGDPDLDTWRQAITELDEARKAFNAEAGIREQDMAFMFDLTTSSDVEVSVKPADSKGEATRHWDFQARRASLCAVWLLDANALAQLGVKAAPWQSAGRLKASIMLMQKYDLIYDGPALADEVWREAKTCEALRDLGVRATKSQR